LTGSPDIAIDGAWQGPGAARVTRSKTGALGGPSAFPQPCFETRVRDRQMEVRAALIRGISKRITS